MWMPNMWGRGTNCVLAGAAMLALGLMLGAGLQKDAPLDQDPYAAILAEQHIAPTAKGITQYLRGLVPGEKERRQIQAIIRQLASSEFPKRESAMQQLVKLGVVPVQDLRDAADSDLTELRVRARQVLAVRSAGNTNSSLVVACFRTIAKRNIPGMTAILLDVLPLYCEEFVQSAGRDALKATARPADAAHLQIAMRAGPTEARVAVIQAISHLLGNQAAAEMRDCLADPEPRVRLQAAIALAQMGDRACLAPLVDLLSAKELRVRQVSATTLRSLTGRTSDYVAWIEPAEQAQVILAWNNWLAKEGATARLNYPLQAPESEMGRTLICLYARNEVIEFDAGGRETLNLAEIGGCPWACQGLPNGTRLVAMYSSNLVIEYAADGKPANRIAVPSGPMSVRRLDNGNTLVACNNAQKVVEVNNSGKVMWEVSLSGGPCDAQRLDNGNTLVTLQNSNVVVEVDPAGREVWKLEDLHTPRTAQRLDNGNTLVCDLGSGRVIEFDSTGREAWSRDSFSSPFCAQRLSAGTTLVSDTESVKEIDPTGRIVWESKQPSIGRVWRY